MPTKYLGAVCKMKSDFKRCTATFLKFSFSLTRGLRFKAPNQLMVFAKKGITKGATFVNVFII